MQGGKAQRFMDWEGHVALEMSLGYLVGLVAALFFCEWNLVAILAVTAVVGTLCTFLLIIPYFIVGFLIGAVLLIFDEFTPRRSP